MNYVQTIGAKAKLIVLNLILQKTLKNTFENQYFSKTSDLKKGLTSYTDTNIGCISSISKFSTEPVTENLTISMHTGISVKSSQQYMKNLTDEVRRKKENIQTVIE